MKLMIDPALREHPKLFRLADELKIEPVSALGILTALWSWTITYRLSGVLGDASEGEIARACLWSGDAAMLVSSLKSSGWLDGDSKLQVHAWNEHQGSFIRKILHDRKRKTRWKPDGNSTETPASPTIPSPSPSPSVPDQAKPSPAPAGGGVFPADFSEFYAAYPRKVKPLDALKAWKQTSKIRPPHAEILAAVERSKAAWKNREPDKIPYPASWLRAGSWGDRDSSAGTKGANGTASTRGVVSDKFKEIDNEPAISV